MQITSMTEKDVPLVAALERQCFSQPWSAQVLEAELQNPNAIFYVARKEGLLAGYVGMHRVMDEGYIANIAVDEAFRRQGVAKTLMQALLTFAKEKRLSLIHIYEAQAFKSSPAGGLQSCS